MTAPGQDLLAGRRRAALGLVREEMGPIGAAGQGWGEGCGTHTDDARSSDRMTDDRWPAAWDQRRRSRAPHIARVRWER